MELKVNIIGEHLTEIDFGEREAGEGRSRLFLGIQKGQDVIDLVPVTAERAIFAAHFEVSPLPERGTNFLGPYAQGTRTARFCYLCWIEEDAEGGRDRFSRIKLHLSSLRWPQVESAARNGTTLVMRFSLLGKRGGPVCASVPDDDIHWEEEKTFD